MPGGQVSASGGSFDPYIDPGNVNVPGIFEPSADLVGQTGKVWAILSGSQWWGGAVCNLSFDGTTYAQIGMVTQNALQGILTAPLPSHADPDNANTLAIDLTQSLGVMPTGATHADADAFRTLAAIVPVPGGIGGVGVSNAPELVSYGAVSATGTYTSNLTYLRRGLFGTSPALAPINSLFIRLQREQSGYWGASSIFQFQLDPQYVGQTLYMKFQSFNVFGKGLQDISTVTAYTYVPSGLSLTAGTLYLPGGWKMTSNAAGNLEAQSSLGNTTEIALK